MAEAGHPSVGGWRTVIARHRVRLHALIPAARLRGQRTVCSAQARRFGASGAISALSEAQGRALVSGHCSHIGACSSAVAQSTEPGCTVVLAPFASASCPPVLRTDSNSNAHAGYGVGLCTLQGCHVTAAGLTWRSTGHPTAGHNSSLRQGRAAVGCRLPLRWASVGAARREVQNAVHFRSST